MMGSGVDDYFPMQINKLRMADRDPSTQNPSETRPPSVAHLYSVSVGCIRSFAQVHVLPRDRTAPGVLHPIARCVAL